MTAERASIGDEWRDGWPSVLASGVGLGVIATPFYSLGALVHPLTAAFGWSRAQITCGPGIVNLIVFLTAAQIGRLVDRVGPRRIAIPGFVAFCLAFMALGLTGSAVWVWCLLWALLGFAQAFANASIWTFAVASRFDRSRGFAFSVALCGMGLMATIAPILVSLGVSRLGWRATFNLLGLGALIIGVPILLTCLHDGPRGHRASPDGTVTADRPTPPGFTLAEALRRPRFWAFAIAALLIAVGLSGLIVHFVAMAVDRGVASSLAAQAAGLIGLASLPGRLASGAMMDRLPGRLVGGGLFLLPVASCLILAVAGHSVPMLLLAAVILGFATGAEFDVLAVLVSRYFGMRSYTAIYGQIAALFGVGMGVGPVLAGFMFDRSGSYDALLVVLAASFTIGASMIALLGPAPHWTTPEPELAEDCDAIPGKSFARG
jgi:MFS family permease